MPQNDPAEMGQKGMNMTGTRTKHSTRTAREDSGSVLTAIRGKVRRLGGVTKWQASLMGEQLGTLQEAAGERSERSRRATLTQSGLMAGHPLPVRSCLADHAPHLMEG
jgi:hypothetical protein